MASPYRGVLLAAGLLAAAWSLFACSSPEGAANPIIPRIPVAQVSVSPAMVGPLAPGARRCWRRVCRPRMGRRGARSLP